MKSREFITQNKMVNESRLIQFFIHESRFNWKKKWGHENILIPLITIQEEKNRPIMLHVETIGDPLVNRESRQRVSLIYFIKYLHLH